MAAIERIEGRASAIAEGMTVVRALPTRQRRMVGAWCFLDHLGPLQFAPGQGMHVGAHPHTALQTFTWLIEGEVLHRDSLGSEQIIRPGQVNLMTAGRGIVHTEDSLADGQRLHAAQLWIALPASAADCPPAFEHFPELPRWQQDGLAFTLLAGRFAGRTMSARFHTPLVGLDVDAPAGGTTRLAVDPAFEYGILTLNGEVLLDGERFGADTFAGFSDGRQHLDIAMAAGSRLLLLGGSLSPNRYRCGGTSSATAGRRSLTRSATGNEAHPASPPCRAPSADWWRRRSPGAKSQAAIGLYSQTLFDSLRQSIGRHAVAFLIYRRYLFQRRTSGEKNDYGWKPKEGGRTVPGDAWWCDLGRHGQHGLVAEGAQPGHPASA